MFTVALTQSHDQFFFFEQSVVHAEIFQDCSISISLINHYIIIFLPLKLLSQKPNKVQA